MFTGIVDHCGVIRHLVLGDKSIRIWINSDFTDLIPGESIAVNGICLTVVDPEGGIFQCDVSPETFRLTNVSALQVGSQVNLERSLRLSDRLGGHFVMGHVDTVCSVVAINKQDEFIMMAFQGLSTSEMPYIVKKGSVSVNGVSLTINEVSEHGFKVMLIPHTLERTNLCLLKVSDKVNIEFDWLARIVVNQLQQIQ